MLMFQIDVGGGYFVINVSLLLESSFLLNKLRHFQQRHERVTFDRL